MSLPPFSVKVYRFERTKPEAPCFEGVHHMMACWCPFLWSYRRFIWRLWWQIARLAICSVCHKVKAAMAEGRSMKRDVLDYYVETQLCVMDQVLLRIEQVLMTAKCRRKLFWFWMTVIYVCSGHGHAGSLSLGLSVFMMTVMHYSVEINVINKGLHTWGNDLHAEGNIDAQWAQWSLRESFFKYRPGFRTLMANNLKAVLPKWNISISCWI